MTKKSSYQMVREFHETFKHPHPEKPQVEVEKVNLIRVKLIQEELDELEEALANRDPIETFDALCDLQYVLDGAFIALGYTEQFKDLGVEEVHRSNMSKLGEDGKPIYREDGKVLKGPNYSEPDLKEVLKYAFLD